MSALEIEVRGVVQGVGFRPFVHRSATAHGLTGWVRNEAGTVRIRVEGEPARLDAFVAALGAGAPPLADVTSVTPRACAPEGFPSFRIADSVPGDARPLPVPPDAAPCDRCLAELRDPTDRRYRFPFITCTDCGPRYTIVEALPYDRERTAMRRFTPCARCAAEYDDPGDRRHHSETNACPACGPTLGWEVRDGGAPAEGSEGALAAAVLRLRAGGSVALKGLGGFHLAVDATDDDAVAGLRERKRRDARPFAVMVATLEEAERLVRVGPEGARLLVSPARPVVLLPAVAAGPLAPSVAPGLETVGVLLPSTPLHHLLVEAAGRPLVMTSGNLSGEPIVATNEEARARLAPLVDGILLHDRAIVSPCDDSVVRPADAGGPASESPGSPASATLRRARGLAPLPLSLPVATPAPLLAVGPHLKSTFTLAEGARAWTSPHVGDLETLETMERFQALLARLRILTGVAPDVVARDAHPGYLSTRIAAGLGVEREVVVQHHHAHVAAVLGEHGRTGPVLGVALDGTGFGEDGHVWGAEWMVADLVGFRRVARLRYAPLPGGEAAVRAPWRAALGYLHLEPDLEAALAPALAGVPPRELAAARAQAAAGLNAPLASSMGRLFDAAAALLGVRHRSAYEGQAAMELEALAGRGRPRPGLPVPAVAGTGAGGELVVDPLPLLAALGEAVQHGRDRAGLAAAFHDAVGAAVVGLCRRLCDAEGLETVALGGGVFQNARLGASVHRGLDEAGLEALAPLCLPVNDGGISYGQAAVAATRLAREAG